MLSRVLVPMDGSEMSEQALEYALDAYPGVDVTVLVVAGEPSSMWGQATGLALADDLSVAADEHAQPVFDRATDIADEYDVEVDTIVDVGHPVRAILNRAGDYDTIVVGAHGGSVADRLFVGNVAEKIFRRSPVPVVVVR